MRKRLVARDEGLLPSAAPGGGITFNEWADWFLENRSKLTLPEREDSPAEPLRAEVPEAPVRREQTIGHHSGRYRSVSDDKIEHRQAGAYQVGAATSRQAQACTVHQEFRILSRILNVAVKKRRLAVNPCGSVEFPVALAGTTRKPHYLSASEQARLEACAPLFLRNIIAIMVEMGLRPYRELTPMRKEQVDLENGIVHLPDSKTVNGITDMPMTDRACVAFASQMKQSGDSDYLFPSPRMGSSKPHIATVCKLWNRTLTRAGLSHFSLYELRHTFATRLSAGGVADHFVTQMLRQGDASVFKRYSQGEAQHDAGSAVEARSAGQRARCEFLYGTGRLEPVF